MLAKLLAEVFGQRRRDSTPRSQPGVGAGRAASPNPEAPTLQRIRKLVAAAERAPIDEHLKILYDGVAVAGLPLLDLTNEAMRRSKTWNPPAKAIHRRERTFNLAQYFLYASRLPGRQVECGVFNGCSALACCLARRAIDPGFSGAGLHLIDSFEGLSPPTTKDWFDLGTAAEPAAASAPPLWPPQGFTAGIDTVRPVFADFPGVELHKGWIPQVLEQLPDARWSFVHIDVDLYEPTRACLDYFLPRLVPGGVILCDDYGSLMFPGAARAWDERVLGSGIPFIELPTGQSVLLQT
jgi:O-methyltransferase